MGRLAISATILLAGCTLDLTGLRAPRSDAGPSVNDTVDAGASDAGDSGSRDASTSDSGAVDAGAEDAGPGLVDAGCVSATEMCDAADDDCDGAVDEGDVCGCPARMRAGRVYLFCSAPESWDAARTYCQERGYDLAVLLTMPEESWVWDQSRTLSGDRDTWMGLTDRATEGEYRWLDGTLIWRAGAPVGGAYNNWRGGSPDELEGEDCVELDDGGGQWADERCDVGAPFVCEAAAP